MAQRVKEPAAIAEFGVTLEGLSKRYGEVEAVRELSLDVPGGRFFSLLAPSGCGKTTTLRMIAGFEEPTTGRILLGGEDMTRTPAHKRPVNTVFQNYALFTHLSVSDNVGFGLRFNPSPSRRSYGESSRRSRSCAWRSWASAGRTSSRAASNSGWRSRAHSCSSPPFSSWTSPSGPWTPSSGERSRSS